MIFNKKIKYVIIEDKVVLLNTDTEQFMLLTDNLDYQFFTLLQQGLSVNSVLEEIKKINSEDYIDLIEEYTEYNIIKE